MREYIHGFLAGACLVIALWLWGKGEVWHSLLGVGLSAGLTLITFLLHKLKAKSP